MILLKALLKRGGRRRRSEEQEEKVEVEVEVEEEEEEEERKKVNSNSAFDLQSKRYQKKIHFSQIK